MSAEIQNQMQNQIQRSIANDPSSWVNQTLFLMPNWKWICAALALVTGFILLRLGRSLIFQLKTNYGQHHKMPPALTYWLKKDVQYPLAWLLAGGVWHLGLQAVAIHERVEMVLALGIHLLILINLMRLAYLGAESIGLAMEDWVKASGGSLDGQLAPFATKVLKIVVITLGFLLSLQSLGFNVGAVLAGLGIGSLALALAAQDTAANLFGSITIILDRPFHRGDYIKVGDTEGVVEEVGFRSTQIRTPYTSLITVPNSIMAKERIDNLGARTSHRWQQNFGIASDTAPQKIEQFIQVIRQRLETHPIILKGENNVFVKSIGDFDIKISLTCFMRPNESIDENHVQQEILLWILALAKELQIEMPYPTQTLHIGSLPRVQA